MSIKHTHNPLLVGRLTQEFAKSVIKTRSKVRESKTYNEAINNIVHENRWQKAIDKELQNLNSH